MTGPQLVAALQSLAAGGFDQSHPVRDEGAKYIAVGCSQCAARVIDGRAVHEDGCPNAARREC